LFQESAPRYRARRNSPVQDQQALAELLAKLGVSGLPINLNQIAKHLNQSTLPFGEELHAELMQACIDITHTRAELMKALGVKQ
jgi:hypothetical protein